MKLFFKIFRIRFAKIIKELIMEATKEIKILHYVLIMIMGIQLSFTFKKLNKIEDDIDNSLDNMSTQLDEVYSKVDDIETHITRRRK